MAPNPCVYLIERGQSEGQAPTVWVDTHERAATAWYGGWTTDPNEARQFMTAAEAEAYVREYAIQSCRVAEHLWLP